MKKNDKKVIIITGSSSGIGKSLREYYEKKENKVIGISLCNDDYCIDISDKKSLEKVFENIKENYKQVDMLINCAGFGLSGAIELISQEQIEKEYAVNVFGTIYAIQLVLPILNPNGKIINISSACALFPLPFRSFYCSSKAAVSMLNDCLRMELSQTKIQSTAICPCDIKTNFTKNRQKNYDTNERYGNAIKLSADRIDNRENKRMSVEKATKIITKIISKRKLKPQYVMGTRNKIMYQIQKFFPKSFVLKVLNKIFYRKK